MFLHIIGHKSKIRVMRLDFSRSSETISRYFNKVFGAICILRYQYMKQAPNETPPKVKSSTLWYPYLIFLTNLSHTLECIVRVVILIYFL